MNKIQLGSLAGVVGFWSSLGLAGPQWGPGVEPVYFVHMKKAPVASQLHAVGLSQTPQWWPELGVAVVRETPEVRALVARRHALGTLKALSEAGITAIEPNRLIRPVEGFSPLPTDPAWLSKQAPYDRMGLTLAWAMIFPFAPLREVTVAIVDSGVDTHHPDLQGRLWTNPGEVEGNGKDDDKNGFADDLHGWNFESPEAGLRDDNSHGTHVAGIIAGEHGNGIGIAGVAPNARVMGLRFMDKKGNGSTYRAIQAMKYAVENGAEVINASWGSDGNSGTMERAIQSAANAGVLFVAAAGNDGRNADIKPMSPASEPGANHLSVASSEGTGELSGFSNFGRTSVDLAAPGSDIFSTVPDGGWGYKSGTSMATPMVVGVAAMVRGILPPSKGLAATRAFRNLLLAAVEPRENYRDRLASGGDLSAARAVGLAFRVLPEDGLWPRALTIAVGDTLPLTYDGTTAGLSWGVSDPRVAQISQSGELTALTEGSVYVTALSGRGESRQAGPMRVVPKPVQSGSGCRGRSNGMELAFIGAIAMRLRARFKKRRT